MGLEDKSVVELRELAQSLGVSNIFSKKKEILIQEISLKQSGEVTKPEPIKVDIVSSDMPVDDALKPFIAMGLKYRVVDGRWYMEHDIRTDEGSVDMPILHVVRCAERIMN